MNGILIKTFTSIWTMLSVPFLMPLP